MAVVTKARPTSSPGNGTTEAEGLSIGQHVVHSGERWRVEGVAPDGVMLESLEGEKVRVPLWQLVSGQGFAALGDTPSKLVSESLARLDLSRVAPADLAHALVLARIIHERQSKKAFDVVESALETL